MCDLEDVKPLWELGILQANAHPTNIFVCFKQTSLQQFT